VPVALKLPSSVIAATVLPLVLVKAISPETVAVVMMVSLPTGAIRAVPFEVTWPPVTLVM